MKAAIIGVGHAPYTRHPLPGQTTLGVMRDAAVAALADAGIDARAVDGLAVSSLSMAPDNAIDVAWRLGFALGWLMQSTNGGSAGLDLVGHACRAVEAGAARVVLAVAGDAMGRTGTRCRRRLQQRHARASDAARPWRGECALCPADDAPDAPVRARKAGLRRARDRAAGVGGGNPNAVYREPLTMEEYLAAPLVADPLCRFDCVPIVTGAQAMVIAPAERAPAGRPAVRLRAFRQSFNWDQQEGDGLETGIVGFARQFWADAGAAPGDIDVASIYDDYPAMVLAQLDDLGMIPDHDLAGFARREIGERRAAINTWGGMLSAGQPGGPAGGLNGVSEAVLQLQGRAGARQVRDARLALATGYGMTPIATAAPRLRRCWSAWNDCGRALLALRGLRRELLPRAIPLPALSRRPASRRARRGGDRRGGDGGAPCDRAGGHGSAGAREREDGSGASDDRAAGRRACARDADCTLRGGRRAARAEFPVVQGGYRDFWRLKARNGRSRARNTILIKGSGRTFPGRSEQGIRFSTWPRPRA